MEPITKSESDQTQLSSQCSTRSNYALCNMNQHSISSVLKRATYSSKSTKETTDTFKEVVFSNCETLSNAMVKIQSNNIDFYTCNLDQSNDNKTSVPKSKFTAFR